MIRKNMVWETTGEVNNGKNRGKCFPPFVERKARSRALSIPQGSWDLGNRKLPNFRCAF